MNRTAAWAFLLSIFLASVGAPAAAAEPVKEAIADWVAHIDGAPDWSARFASLDYDSTNDTATLSGLQLEHVPAGVKLSFEPISISGYSESGDTFDVDRVSTDGITVAAEGLSGALANFRLEGIGNIARQFGAGVEWDNQRPFTSLVRAYARFVDIRLAHGTIGAMSFQVQTDDANVAVSYEDFAIDDWADGKIASATTGRLAIEATTPEGPFTVSIGSTAGRDFDYAAMLRVYDPDQYVGGVGDGIWRNAAALIEYKDIVFDGPDTKFTLASAGMENLRVRQPERNVAEFFDRAMLDPGADPEPTPEELRALVGYFSAFSVDTMTMRNMVIEADDGGSGRLDGITVTDLSSEGIGEFSIDDFAATKPGEGFVNIGRIALGGVVFPPLDALLEAAEAEETGAPFDYARLTTQFAFFEALAIDADVPDSPRIKLDKARLDLGNYVGPIPTLLSLEISGADLPVTAIDDPSMRSMLQMLGYDRARGDFTAKLAWNEADQSIAIDDLRFALTDFGAVSMNARLVGLPREAIDDLYKLPDALFELSFVEGGLALENYDVLDRWIDQQSAATGVEPAQLRQQVAVLLTQLTAGIGGGDFGAQLQRAISAAVTAPGPITVTATPVAPVPLTALMVLAQSAPANLPELLGIAVEHTAGAP